MVGNFSADGVAYCVVGRCGGGDDDDGCVNVRSFGGGHAFLGHYGDGGRDDGCVNARYDDPHGGHGGDCG